MPGADKKLAVAIPAGNGGIEPRSDLQAKGGACLTQALLDK